MSKRIHVAVGIILNKDKIFLTKRLEHVHQGGKWEFPGGKVELEETVTEALYRELKEEIAIEVISCQPYIEIKHDYGDKQVLLDVYTVDHYSGVPTAQEGQQQTWYNPLQLKELDFPAANKAIVNKLLSDLGVEP
jgi:8-oxo-dGTP diphosphatase